MASKVDMKFVERKTKAASESMVKTGEISDLLLELAASVFGRRKMIPSAFLGPIALDAAMRIEKIIQDHDDIPYSPSPHFYPFSKRRVKKTARLVLENQGLAQFAHKYPYYFYGVTRAVVREAALLARMKNQWVSLKQANKQLRVTLKKSTA